MWSFRMSHEFVTLYMGNSIGCSPVLYFSHPPCNSSRQVLTLPCNSSQLYIDVSFIPVYGLSLCTRRGAILTSGYGRRTIGFCCVMLPMLREVGACLYVVQSLDLPDVAQEDFQ